MSFTHFINGKPKHQYQTSAEHDNPPSFFSPSARCTAPSRCCTCPRRTSRRPSRKMPPWKSLRVFLGGMRWRREARYARPKLQLQRRGWWGVGWGQERSWQRTRAQLVRVNPTTVRTEALRWDGGKCRRRRRPGRRSPGLSTLESAAEK